MKYYMYYISIAKAVFVFILPINSDDMKKLPSQIVTKTLFYAPTISVFSRLMTSEKLIVIILTIYQCGGIVTFTVT